MYKTLCVVVFLLPTFAFSQTTKVTNASAPATTFPSPQIVARAKLPHQTAAIPTTTMFTPIQDGLYRLSVYGTLLNTGTTGLTWNFNLGWTDDAGAESIPGLVSGYDFNFGAFGQFDGYSGNIAPIGGPATVFEAKAGQPITYSVTAQGDPDGTAYSLYFTLERLE
jgi:hypothetical protein